MNGLGKHNLMFSDLNKDKNFTEHMGFMGTSFSSIGKSMGGFFSDLKSKFSGANADIEATTSRILDVGDAVTSLDQYNAALGQGQAADLEFMQGLDNQHLTDYFNSLEGGNATIQSYEAFTRRATSAQHSQTLSAKLTTLAYQGLTLALNALASIGISMLINYATSLVRQQEELRQSAIESARAFQQEAGASEDYKKRIQDLREALDSGTLSHADAYDKRYELIQIQNEIIERYGMEAKAVDLLNGSLENQLTLLDQVLVAQAKENLSVNDKAYRKAETEMERQQDYRFGVQYHVANDDDIIRLLDSFRDRGIYLNNNGEGQISLYIKGDAREVKAAIIDLYSELEDLKRDVPDAMVKYIDHIQKNLSKP